MGYYFNKVVTNISFEEAVSVAVSELEKENFEVVSTVDFKKTFKNKISEDLNDYTVLGVCDAKLAYSAMQADILIGLMLPCNILIKRINDISIEIAIVDPTESLSLFQNKEVDEIAKVLQERLIRVINNL